MSPALDGKKVAIMTDASGGIGAGPAAAFRATGRIDARSLEPPLEPTRPGS